MQTELIPCSLKMTICERLKRARIAAGFPTAKEFAQKKGLKISTYNLHEAGTRSMSFEIIECYANLLNIHINWLLTGVEPKSRNFVSQVPFIKWEEVHSFPTLDLSNRKWIHADADVHPHSFALEVQNDAMDPRYPEGTIILIDCQQTYKNRDFVLLHLEDVQLTTFKQLVLMDGLYYGKSLNPEYKPIPLSAHTKILGKVVQAKLIF